MAVGRVSCHALSWPRASYWRVMMSVGTSLWYVRVWCEVPPIGKVGEMIFTPLRVALRCCVGPLIFQEKQSSKGVPGTRPTYNLRKPENEPTMSVVGIDFGNQNAVIAAAGRGGVDVILNGNSNRLNP